MNIGIIGSGGREHSLCYKLSKSIKIKEIFCMPGNAGTEDVATNVNIDISDFKEIYRIILKNNIELVIVGPEAPLVNGLVDFISSKNIKIFGPNKNSAQLEGSKIFMKNFCNKFNIPSAKYYEIYNLDYAKKIVDKINTPIVVKSDGLASGKGVTICNTKETALIDINNILNGKFESSKKVIIEEFLEGEEASYFIITDGYQFKSLGTAQDHKRIGERDTGLNTGGMGAYSPSFLINNIVEKKIIDKIIKPTLDGMRKDGIIYKGILYAGLMIKDNEPKLIEYNIRLGDPECQVLMMRLKSDLLGIILSTFDNSLKNQVIEWTDEPGITIVAASKGYPGVFKKNEEIGNLDKIIRNDNQQLFHAGTKKNKFGKIVSNSGRVFNSTVISNNLKSARKKALDILDQIKWENKYYRRDIGYKIIDK